jgi:hypothetical protein
MVGTIRIRSVAWFATAVVLTLLCTLLVTQAWSVGAAPGDSDSTFVPTAGCRVTDTRATSTVGPRNVPLGANQTFPVTIHGSNGECTGALTIPADAVGVALNVTAVNATASSNIRIFPADLTTVPLLSNLNVSAGAPPTPNKVDVKLSPDGKIKVYNFNGNVNIVIDIVGYYTNSTLKELQSQIDDLKKALPFAVTVFEGSEINLTTEPAGYVTVTVSARVAGQVTLNSTAIVTMTTNDEDVICALAEATNIPSLDTFRESAQWFQNDAVSDGGSVSGTRTFDIAADATVDYVLACRGSRITPDSGGVIRARNITAVFTPAV